MGIIARIVIGGAAGYLRPDYQEHWRRDGARP
jgi:hypothetical protein